MNVELPICLLDWINNDKIHWYGLSKNPSEGAMQLLEKNQDKIHWQFLSGNYSKHAIQLLEKNQDKIVWFSEPWLRLYGLSSSPYIFTYDYKQMKQNCMLFKEDLMKNRFHPCNIPKFKDWRVDGFETDFN